MCKYCEEGESLVDFEHISVSLAAWSGDTLAKDLPTDTVSLFIDRGYLRFVDKADAGCLDHGFSIKLTKCPACLEDL